MMLNPHFVHFADPTLPMKPPEHSGDDASADRRTRLFEALIESVFDGVLIVSGSGKMIYHNQLFLDIWNFPPEILASGSDDAALEWAAEQTTDPAGFLARVAEVYQQPAERVREEVTMKDGRTYDRCGTLVRTGDGDEPWMWTFRDITLRKHHELALQRSELRYRTLFDSLDEGFCVISMIFDEAGRPSDFRFIEVNPAFALQSGLDDPVGRRMREFAPHHEQHWFDSYGGVALTGKPVRFEHEANSLRRWFEVYAFPVDAPELHRVGVLLTDVTRRHEASEALRVSEQFSRAVMESSPDCIKILDASGQIEFMNVRGQELMEIDDFSTYGGRLWCEMWQGGDREKIRAALDEAMLGRPARFQAMCHTAKGTAKWWDVMIAKFEKDAFGCGPPGLISVSREITDNKRAEQELLLAKEAAESASRAKDRFLATLSHELRTPLNPVLLMASSLSEDASLPAALREQLRMIERNISLEARLIDDLLDITRVSSGKLQLRPEPCDVHTLLGLVAEMVRSDAREKNLTLKLDLQAQYHGMIGDPTRLQQVFWNLLRNAVKFTPTGGQIHLRTRDAGPPASPRLRIEVQDSGIGISPQSLCSIFEPFEQEKRATPSASDGLGLGLAIAHAIVELHQGTLRAESSGAGQGAIFSIDAPATHPPTARLIPMEPEGSVAETEHEPPLRLLLVEDHQPTLEALRVLLSKAGHTVITAGTLAEARRAASEQRFDGLISDVGLPDGTGFDLMEELSSGYGLRGIVLSGYGMEEDLRRSREVGFVAHLVKPVRIGDLRQTLWKLLPAEKR